MRRTTQHTTLRTIAESPIKEVPVVSGYAVGIHEHPRYAGDLDMWLNSTQQNAEDSPVAAFTNIQCNV